VIITDLLGARVFGPDFVGYVRWRHRGSFLVQWEDIERLDVRRINLRSEFTKVSSQLP
jgi:hypothetical protein